MWTSATRGSPGGQEAGTGDTRMSARAVASVGRARRGSGGRVRTGRSERCQRQRALGHRAAPGRLGPARVEQGRELVESHGGGRRWRGCGLRPAGLHVKGTSKVSFHSSPGRDGPFGVTNSPEVRSSERRQKTRSRRGVDGLEAGRPRAERQGRAWSETSGSLEGRHLQMRPNSPRASLWLESVWIAAAARTAGVTCQLSKGRACVGAKTVRGVTPPLPLS